MNHLVAFMYGLNRLRKKDLFGGGQCRLLQGLKPSIDLIGFIGLAKAMPLLQSG